jgi:endonuclease/exonuclease/phosphatase family metal-dependent hydrolase
MTYNVRSMRDDREALGRVIRSAEPDVVLIQESPRFARWRSLCAELARRSNLVVVNGGRPAGSNLILSTLGVDVLETRDVLFSRDPRLHRRGTAIAVLSRHGAKFAVAGTHLDLSAEPRLRHVDELDAAISRHVPASVPTIVGGDINDVPSSPVWRALTSHRVDVFAGRGDGFTSPAVGARRRIDAIFLDPSIVVVDAHVLAGPDVEAASDHRPLVTDLEI